MGAAVRDARILAAARWPVSGSGWAATTGLPPAPTLRATGRRSSTTRGCWTATSPPTRKPPRRRRPRAARPTRAGEYTPAASVDLTDDQLLAACAELVDDPAAQEQIVATLEWREEMERQRDAELAEHRAQRERERSLAWEAAVAADDASPLTNPARRPARRLSLDQVCREEYDAHVHLAYLTAETDCRGSCSPAKRRPRASTPSPCFRGQPAAPATTPARNCGRGGRDTAG
ncbi:MAG TPA: hypothetical protein VFV66_17565 [Nonomuraea sp.]|nr:hypothetical protein [Nonomuraea sp.]